MAFRNDMKKKKSRGSQPSRKNIEEYFASLVLMGTLLAFLGFLGIYLTGSPLAFVVIIAPSLAVLSFLIFIVYYYKRFFRAGDGLTRFSKSFGLAVASELILLPLGCVLWLLLLSSSPGTGP